MSNVVQLVTRPVKPEKLGPTPRQAEWLLIACEAAVGTVTSIGFEDVVEECVDRGWMYPGFNSTVDKYRCQDVITEEGVYSVKPELRI